MSAYQSTSENRQTGLISLALFTACCVIYGLSASDTVQWGDSSHFMYRINSGDLIGNLGLALSHPLHQLLGQFMVALFGPEPVYMTWVSVIAGGLAVAFVYATAYTLTRSVAASLFAAISLALASTFWRVSTLVEVYTLGAACLAMACFGLARYASTGRPLLLWLACFAAGLGGANDVPSGLILPVLVAYVIVEWRAGRLTFTQGCVAGGAYLAGVMPFGYLVLAELFTTGDLVATLRSALFGTMWSDEVLHVGISRRAILVDILFPIMNFPNLLLPLAFFGIFRARKLGMNVPLFWALIASLAIHALFALRYDISEQYNFFLPLYVLLTIFSAYGWLALEAFPLARWLKTAAIVLLAVTPLNYAAATHISREMDLLGSFARNKPYRDDYAYLMLPWTVAEQSADKLSRHALDIAGEKGLIVFEDWMAHWCVRYLAVLEYGFEPRMIWSGELNLDEVIGEARANDQRVALIPVNRDNPETPLATGAWQRTGDLYELDFPSQP